MSIGSSYELIEPDANFPDQYFWYFKIIEGEYEGSVFKFDTVKFDERPDNRLSYSFTYSMVQNPTGADLSPGSKFTMFVSKILEHFLKNNYDDLISGTTRKENIKKK